jgi:acyl-CoA thioester hydrolase
VQPLSEFVLEIEVAPSDIDQLGHASNIAYVRWVQDVAVGHSNAVGLDFDAYKAIGAVFVVLRHEIDYLRSALRGDRIKLRTWVSSASAATCRRETELLRVDDGVVVARASTTWGFIDAVSARPRRIPDDIIDRFGEVERKLVRRATK